MTQESGFDPWKIPWRGQWQPAPVFLPGKSHGQRSLAGYSPRGPEESNTTENTHTHDWEQQEEVPSYGEVRKQGQDRNKQLNGILQTPEDGLQQNVVRVSKSRESTDFIHTMTQVCTPQDTTFHLVWSCKCFLPEGSLTRGGGDTLSSISLKPKHFRSFKQSLMNTQVTCRAFKCLCLSPWEVRSSEIISEQLMLS